MRERTARGGGEHAVLRSEAPEDVFTLCGPGGPHRVRAQDPDGGAGRLDRGVLVS